MRGIREAGDSGVDLPRLVGDSDGYMDQVHSLRDMYAADLVHILVSRSDVGGRAQLHTEELADLEEPFGFGLTLARIYGELTFAHELGHNMGLHHDRYVLSFDPGSASNFGYVNQRAFDPGAPESSRWRTIMSYLTSVGKWEVSPANRFHTSLILTSPTMAIGWASRRMIHPPEWMGRPTPCGPSTTGGRSPRTFAVAPVRPRREPV